MYLKTDSSIYIIMKTYLAVLDISKLGDMDIDPKEYLYYGESSEPTPIFLRGPLGRQLRINASKEFVLVDPENEIQMQRYSRLAQYWGVASSIDDRLPKIGSTTDLTLIFENFFQKRGEFYSIMVDLYSQVVVDMFFDVVSGNDQNPNSIKNSDQKPNGILNLNKIFYDSVLLSKNVVFFYNNIPKSKLIAKIHPAQASEAEPNIPQANFQNKEVLGLLIERISTFEGFTSYVREVVSKVCSKVRGQDGAVKDLAMKIVSYLADPDSQGHPILVTGPTGSGKTMCVREICRVVGIPFQETSVPTLTPSAYKGTNIQDVLVSMVQRVNASCGGKPSRAVYFLDEFGKILGKGDGLKNQIQAELLKILEPGAKLTTETKFPSSGVEETEFSGLVILSDAFSTIDGDVSEDSLLEAGFISELVGRLQLVTPFRLLGVEDYVDILTSAEGSIIETKRKTVAAIGATLEFSEDAIREIAEIASKTPLGARHLSVVVSSVVDEKLSDVTFNPTDLPRKDGRPVIRIESGDIPDRLRRNGNVPKEKRPIGFSS